MFVWRSDPLWFVSFFREWGFNVLIVSVKGGEKESLCPKSFWGRENGSREGVSPPEKLRGEEKR
jgi:hypothetical protein